MDKKTFLIREKIIFLIRKFFVSQGFHELETPILVKAPDTAPYNEVFETTMESRNIHHKMFTFLSILHYNFSEINIVI